MSSIHIQYLKTQYGELILGSYNNALCLCDWRYRKMRSSVDKRLQQRLAAAYNEQTDDVIEDTRQQLSEYFSGNRQEFNLPLTLAGSEFQQQVWRQLIDISYGKTLSYLELSKQINNVKAVRAVAAANGANALSIIVPCHRIVGSDGKLVGYAGGLEAKRKLLTLEKGHFMDVDPQETLSLF